MRFLIFRSEHSEALKFLWQLITLYLTKFLHDFKHCYSNSGFQRF